MATIVFFSHKLRTHSLCALFSVMSHAYQLWSSHPINTTLTYGGTQNTFKGPYSYESMMIFSSNQYNPYLRWDPEHAERPLFLWINCDLIQSIQLLLKMGPEHAERPLFLWINCDLIQSIQLLLKGGTQNTLKDPYSYESIVISSNQCNSCLKVGPRTCWKALIPMNQSI